VRRPERISNELIRELGLWFLIKEDFNNHYRDWTRPGFRAMVVYRFGAWTRGLRSLVLMAITHRIYISLHRYIRNHYGIELSWRAKIGRRFHIGHQHAIVIHQWATIGDDCTVRQGVTLGVGAEFSPESAPVLGNRVDIGAGAMIIGKVRIGDDVRIGPNAVVMHDVPSNTSVIAPPARYLPRPAAQANSPDGARPAKAQDANTVFHVNVERRSQ
jgi:serine O-acetyltransferase